MSEWKRFLLSGLGSCALIIAIESGVQCVNSSGWKSLIAFIGCNGLFEFYLYAKGYKK